MSAFFIATTNIKNMEKFQEYSKMAGPTFAAFGGELVSKGKVETALAGAADHQAVGIVKFPDMAALDNWYQSPDYQKLIPLRDEAVDMNLVTYSVPK